MLVIFSYCCLQWSDHKQWSLISRGLISGQQLRGIPQKEPNHHYSEIAEAVWCSTKSDLAEYVELTGTSSFIWYEKVFLKCTPLFWYQYLIQDIGNLVGIWRSATGTVFRFGIPNISHPFLASSFELTSVQKRVSIVLLFKICND